MNNGRLFRVKDGAVTEPCGSDLGDVGGIAADSVLAGDISGLAVAC